MILSLVWLAPTGESQEGSPPAHAAQLALDLVPSHARSHGIPRVIVLRLRNISQHDVLLPQPHENCADGMYGSLFFRVDIQRTSGPVATLGCFADYDFHGGNLQHRIKTWKRLAPRQSLDFRKDIAISTRALLGSTQAEGKYSFSAAYEPPFISKEEKALLHKAGIDFAEDSLNTPWLTYKR